MAVTSKTMYPTMLYWKPHRLSYSTDSKPAGIVAAWTRRPCCICFGTVHKWDWCGSVGFLGAQPQGIDSMVTIGSHNRWQPFLDSPPGWKLILATCSTQAISDKTKTTIKMKKSALHREPYFHKQALSHLNTSCVHGYSAVASKNGHRCRISWRTVFEGVFASAHCDPFLAPQIFLDVHT